MQFEIATRGGSKQCGIGDASRSSVDRLSLGVQTQPSDGKFDEEDTPVSTASGTGESRPGSRGPDAETKRLSKARAVSMSPNSPIDEEAPEDNPLRPCTAAQHVKLLESSTSRGDVFGCSRLFCKRNDHAAAFATFGGLPVVLLMGDVTAPASTSWVRLARVAGGIVSAKLLTISAVMYD